jgi:hypothetical protein
MISGYYHIVDPNVIRNSLQLTSVDTTALGHLTQGQLKITITTDKSLKDINASVGASIDVFSEIKNQ